MSKAAVDLCIVAALMSRKKKRRRRKKKCMMRLKGNFDPEGFLFIISVSCKVKVASLSFSPQKM